jgi:hypothetical protein
MTATDYIEPLATDGTDARRAGHLRRLAAGMLASEGAPPVRRDAASAVGSGVLVYIAGPIRKGDIWANVAQADRATFALMSAGIGVINPMLSCWAGAGMMWAGEPHPLAHGPFRFLGADSWLSRGLEIVGRCDAVLRLPGESYGADAEVAHAKALGIRVFDDVAELIAWA